MKKILSILLVAALVVCFAFTLVACNKNKDTTESFTLTEDELKTTLSTLQNDLSFNVSTFRTVITTKSTTDEGTATQNKDVYSIKDTGIWWDNTATNPDGSSIRTLNVNTGSEHYSAEFLNGSEISVKTAYYTSFNQEYRSISALRTDSGCLEAANFLSNISDDKAYYDLKDIAGTHYKHNGNIVKTIYTCTYNDGNLEADAEYGTLRVTVENNKITEIYYTKTRENYENTTKYVYEFENPDFPKNAIDWFDRYPMA